MEPAVCSRNDYTSWSLRTCGKVGGAYEKVQTYIYWKHAMNESRVEQTKRNKVTLNIIRLTNTLGYNRLMLLVVERIQVIPVESE